MSSSKVLVVDDNPEIRKLIESRLEDLGYQVFSASNGQETLHVLRAQSIDTILLDLQLPDGDGLEIISSIRKLSDSPIIVISGRGSTVDMVVGLEMGADDYISKPFEIPELIARVKASVRRHKNAKKSQTPVATSKKRIRFGNFILDEMKYQVFYLSGHSCDLTTMEFELLHALVRNPNIALTRAQLLDAIHPDNHNISDRAIDIQITRIRKKLSEEPDEISMIKTIRHVGYMLICPTEVLSD